MSNRENRLHDEIQTLRAQVRKDHTLTAECANMIERQLVEIAELRDIIAARDAIIAAFVAVAKERKK